MTRVLLDHNVPRPLAGLLTDHVAEAASTLRWDGLSNGDLLNAAELAGFDVMITADTNIRYQQNLSARTLSLVVLSTNAWPVVRDKVALVAGAVNAAVPGSYLEVFLGSPMRNLRP